MKKYRWIFALTVLVLAALACNAVMGGGTEPEAPEAAETVEVQPQPETESEVETEEPEQEPTPDEPSQGGSDASSEFPLPEDATGMMDMGEAGVNFQTELSVDDAVEFYRAAFKEQGLTERELLTTISEGVFSMVFDGHASGKAVVIQGVDLGNGTTNINIRLEDV